MVGVVLSSLAFACVGQGRFTHVEADRFPEFLRGLGYDVSVVHKGGLVEITDGDLKFTVGPAVSKSYGDPIGRVVFAQLTGGFRVDRPVRKEEAQAWSGSYAYGRGNIDAYLDGTVFSEWRADIDNMDEADIRKDFSEFIRKLKGMQSVYLRGLHPQVASPLETYDNLKPNLNMVVYGLETRDLAYLVRQWNMDFSGASGMVGVNSGTGGFAQFVTVNNMSFYLDVPTSIYLPLHPGAIEFAVCGAPTSADVLKGITWATVRPIDDEFYSIQKQTDLSQGITLGELKARIGNFANKIAALHLNLDWVGSKRKKN